MKQVDFVPEILYEDNHLLVVVKPPGILSQEDATGEPDMLTLMKRDLKKRYNKPGEVFLGLLHRLDRPVGGVMVFAKTSKCASRISAQIRERSVTKIYRAVVKGTVFPERASLCSYILKNDNENTVVVYDSENAPVEAKEAKLSYEIIGMISSAGDQCGNDLTLLRVFLHTGRSHQIRAQLAHVGYPILGDRKYGRREEYSGDICLESYYLKLRHPITNETMEFEIPLGKKWPWNEFQERSEE